MALIAVMLIAIAASVAAAITFASLLNTNQQTRAIRDRQLALDNAYITLREAESSQRGYLLTGDAKYLTSFDAAMKVLPAQAKNLVKITRGTPEQASIDHLVAIAQGKWDELNQTVALKQRGDSDGALAVVNSGEGAQLMDQIDAAKSQIDTQHATALNSGRSSAGKLGDYALAVVSLAAAMTLILGGVIYYLYLKAIAAERELDRAKDEFVSLASHQLRTPATGIKSILSMLASGDFGSLNERQHHYLGRALESNEREIGIIEELLNVAKADAGRLVLRPARVDICDLINTIVLEQRPAIDTKQQDLVVNQPDTPLTLMADQEKLYMAIGNLIDNARKYTPVAGSIHVAVRGKRNMVQVEVADSGVGIDEADVSRIFDRFHRARGVLSGNVEGTGLGLYLARRIVELHNGTIEVDSKKGHGSTFTLSLPMKEAS